MTNLIINRKYTKTETQGLMIVVQDVSILYQCFCLELPWFNNQHDISCIPSGIYQVIKYSYEKHPNVFWIQDVPNRTGIMIHIGNFATGLKIDTHGCILPGTDFIDIDKNGNLDIIHPDIAMKELNRYLPDSFKLHIL